LLELTEQLFRAFSHDKKYFSPPYNT
jgi:hypothetical protein